MSVSGNRWQITNEVQQKTAIKKSYLHWSESESYMVTLRDQTISKIPFRLLEKLILPGFVLCFKQQKGLIQTL